MYGNKDISAHNGDGSFSSCKIKGTVDILGIEWTNSEVLSSGLGISVLGSSSIDGKKTQAASFQFHGAL